MFSGVQSRLCPKEAINQDLPGCRRGSVGVSASGVWGLAAWLRGVFGVKIALLQAGDRIATKPGVMLSGLKLRRWSHIFSTISPGAACSSLPGVGCWGMGARDKSTAARRIGIKGHHSLLWIPKKINLLSDANEEKQSCSSHPAVCNFILCFRSANASRPPAGLCTINTLWNAQKFNQGHLLS